MSAENYNGFTHLQNETLKMASFLRATAKRIVEPGLSTEEIISRLNDVAEILDASVKEAEEKYYALPKPSQTTEATQ